MKAVICTRYGPPEVLQLSEVAKPTPKDHEVLVRIHATAVTASDCIVRGFKIPRWRPMGLMMGLVIGFTKPRNPILGMVLAGDVESAGKAVTRFTAGDPVYGHTFAPRQIRFGAYAEYIALPENSLIALKSPKATYEEAAALPYGAGLALFFLRKGNIQRGQKVLIYGASGSIGTAAIQLVKHHFGAEVTGVCSTTNVELVKSLGADQVIDYTREDLTNTGGLYDFVFDAVGKSKSSELKRQCQKALTPNGKYLSVDDGSPRNHVEDLSLLNDLVEAGKMKPVIDRRYPLEQIVEAHRYVEAGHKKGNVVITLDDNDKFSQKSGENAIR
jgi:NADPH:quinone reductase-like Zn-dependent oxidoreductase